MYASQQQEASQGKAPTSTVVTHKDKRLRCSRCHRHGRRVGRTCTRSRGPVGRMRARPSRHRRRSADTTTGPADAPGGGGGGGPRSRRGRQACQQRPDAPVGTGGGWPRHRRRQQAPCPARAAPVGEAIRARARSEQQRCSYTCRGGVPNVRRRRRRLLPAPQGLRPGVRHGRPGTGPGVGGHHREG